MKPRLVVKWGLSFIDGYLHLRRFRNGAAGRLCDPESLPASPDQVCCLTSGPIGEGRPRWSRCSRKRLIDPQGRSTDPYDRRAAQRDRAPVRLFRQFSEGDRKVRRKARRATPSKSLECDLQGLLHDFQPWDCLQRRRRSGQKWSRNPLNDDRPDRRSIPRQVRGPVKPARHGYPHLTPNAPQLPRERRRSE